MRRSLVVAAVTAALVLSSPGPGGAAEPDVPGATPVQAERTLATVQGLLEPATAQRTTGERGDFSLAMRELFKALPSLGADDRRTARAIFARPTDGDADPVGDGYTVPAKKKCGKKVCVHWVESTADAPPNQAWVKKNLQVMGKVWKAEIGELGFRKPVGDRKRGGNPKLDVYLKELGSRGIYGYCTPERKVRGHKWLASGYCVLDNDFAKAQYGAPPIDSLRVTAAHEFFHAVQFGYDYAEDKWLMEATATWMEERVADDVNDNRQYLPYGQVGTPTRSLDTFNRQGFDQYGNWAFFEYLSNRFGTGIVKQIWSRAGAYKGSGHQYSTKAVRTVLAGKRGGFTDVFRKFAAANTVPGRSYPEGGTWPVAPATATWTLTKDARKDSGAAKIDHMASRNYVVRPGDGIGGKGWKLRVTIDGPAKKTSPAAYLVVKRKKGIARLPIGLSKKGKGSATIAFGGTVSWAKVVVVNASTRFSCWRRTEWSCQGKARDNNLKFAVTATAFKRKG